MIGLSHKQLKLQASDLQLYLKRGSGTGVSCEFCKTFKNTFFTEHLWTTASEILKLLLQAF